LKPFQFLLIGQFTEKQQITGFLKAAAFVRDKPGYNFGYVDPSVNKAPRSEFRFIIADLRMRLHLTDLRQPGQHPLAFDVAQSSFNIIFGIQGRIHQAAGCRH